MVNQEQILVTISSPFVESEENLKLGFACNTKANGLALSSETAAGPVEEQSRHGFHSG